MAEGRNNYSLHCTKMAVQCQDEDGEFRLVYNAQTPFIPPKCELATSVSTVDHEYRSLLYPFFQCLGPQSRLVPSGSPFKPPGVFDIGAEFSADIANIPWYIGPNVGAQRRLMRPVGFSDQIPDLEELYVREVDEEQVENRCVSPNTPPVPDLELLLAAAVPSKEIRKTPTHADSGVGHLSQCRSNSSASPVSPEAINEVERQPKRLDQDNLSGLNPVPPAEKSSTPLVPSDVAKGVVRLSKQSRPNKKDERSHQSQHGTYMKRTRKKSAPNDLEEDSGFTSETRPTKGDSNAKFTQPANESARINDINLDNVNQL